MCGRYFVEIGEEELREIVAEAERNARWRDFGGGEVFPGTVAPVIASSGAGFMKWGFPGGDGRRPLINARSETAAVARAFCEAWADRRCIVPASGYFEWKPAGAGLKEKYAFTLPNRQPMYMAGIYSPCGQFAILTRDAAPALAAIHGRMPVIIPKPLAGAWLRASPSAAGEALGEALEDLRFAAVPPAGGQQMSLFG
jgi:putative SOS response-associated peptidase YedK